MLMGTLRVIPGYQQRPADGGSDVLLTNFSFTDRLVATPNKFDMAYFIYHQAEA